MGSIVIGTAGHIDHGKTALVKALTGTDTDRLKEEKARGITIELGFAELTLRDGLQAGIVDVPGHERFVRNMVAGTTGIDLVLLVVAADEGVMPQTREHLDICNILGIERGLVALTKVDLVDDPDWLAMVQDDLRTELTGTFLEEAPMVAVSSRTRQGLDELVQTLATVATTVERRSRDAPSFLGIDRVFTMHGFGTVVTGSLVSGQLSVDDSVDVLPDGGGRLRGIKIRGLQNHGRETNRVEAGQRTAINLAGVDLAALARGQVLVHAGTLETGHDFDCTLRLVPGAKPLPARARAIFHVGTARSMASVKLMDSTELEGSEEAYVSIHCEEPLAAFPGHRYLLRGFAIIEGRGTTLGGGRILTVLPPRRSRRDRQRRREELAILDTGTDAERLVTLLGQSGATGADINGLRMRSGLSTRVIQRELDRLMAEQKVLKFDREQGRFIEATRLNELGAQAKELLTGFHAANPLLPGMPAEQLRSSLSSNLDVRLFRLLVDRLARRETAIQEGEYVRLADHRVQLDATDTRTERSVRDTYEQAGLTPPRLEEVAGRVDRPEKDVLEIVRHLTRTGFLTHVSGDMYVPTTVIDDLRHRLIQHLGEHEEINTQDFKTMVGGTRKHVIPLAEFFDREKTTLRVGQKRVLRKKSPSSQPQGG